jgi:nucleotide-binding universal stress UspA family protein
MFVVCGVDWSDESMAAVNVAAGLSKRLGATLVLAHVVEESTTFPYGSEPELNRNRHRAHTKTTRLFHSVRRQLDPLDVEGRVLYGAPADELAELAAQEEAALLLVGSRGRGAVKAALFGSVSSAVSRAADCPVVIVRSDMALAGPEATGHRATIVCGVDDSQQARGAARVAAALAGALDAELMLVHAYPPARSAATIPAGGIAPPVDLDELEERHRRAGETLLGQVAEDAVGDAPVRTRLETGAAASALERCAREEQAELIVVGTHGHGPLASALLGSTSVALAAGGPVPVVMVSERAARRAAQAPNAVVG